MAVYSNDNVSKVRRVVRIAVLVLVFGVLMMSLVGCKNEYSKTTSELAMPSQLAGGRFKMIDEFNDGEGFTTFVYVDKSVDVVYIATTEKFAMSYGYATQSGENLIPMADPASESGYMTEDRYWDTKKMV